MSILFSTLRLFVCPTEMPRTLATSQSAEVDERCEIL